MLEISGLAKRFGKLSIFKNFTHEVPQNGFSVLIGPSGCGKSTLFNLLVGAVSKDAGRIDWQGRSYDHIGQCAAYMQQKDLLLPWLSLLDNALLPARIAKKDMTAAATQATTFFNRLGLGGFESYRPRQVSGGMRQRCALARTLMFERELVLLDEPLSALDAITRRRLQHLLLMLQSDFAKSILMITHDIEEALLLADDLVVLTSAPMRVRERFALAQPKPRHIADPRLLEIKAYVLDILQEEADNDGR
jgi:NitT/TauT family transport system ATP-binding protein